MGIPDYFKKDVEQKKVLVTDISQETCEGISKSDMPQFIVLNNSQEVS